MIELFPNFPLSHHLSIISRLKEFFLVTVGITGKLNYHKYTFKELLVSWDWIIFPTPLASSEWASFVHWDWEIKKKKISLQSLVLKLSPKGPDCSDRTVLGPRPVFCLLACEALPLMDSIKKSFYRGQEWKCRKFPQMWGYYLPDLCVL